MKIAFDVYGSGCGDNGGTRTIIKSANTLVDLGHEVFVFSHCDNFFTWNPTKCTHLTSELDPMDFPDVDVIIATACTTANHAMAFRSMEKAKIATYWVRGVEVWSKPYNYLIKTYNLPFNFIMVNSIWQKEFIGKRSPEELILQYPGLELDFWKVNPSKKSKDFIKVGGLYHPASHKGPEDFYKIAEKTQEESNIEFGVMSAKPVKFPTNGAISNVIENPPEEVKRDWYQSCDLWLATTHLDGLHLPPMESGLCGATLVANDSPTSGMQDHAIHQETSIIFDKIESAVESIQALSDSPEYRKELNENHRKLLKKKMKSRKTQMKNMIKLFEGRL